MGLTFGKEHVLRKNKTIKNTSPQLYNHLTEEQIRILQTTWQIIKPNMVIDFINSIYLFVCFNFKFFLFTSCIQAEIGVIIFKR